MAEELERALRPVLHALTHHARGRGSDGRDELLTADEVADLLRIDRRTLRRLVLEGAVPPPILIGDRTQRWRRSVIGALIERREKEALTAGRGRGCVDEP